MLRNEIDIRKEAACQCALAMLAAARTAPKAGGKDNLSLALAEGKTIETIANKMKELAVLNEMPNAARDAENIMTCDYLVLAGTKLGAYGLKKCGLCGFKDCGEKNQHPGFACIFNTGDLGIAIGSAVSIAADWRVDTRVMYTAGCAALALGLLGKDTKIAYGIPLSISGKNPFFDRKPVAG
jgi:uncharacterized ferredoxin-like protein